jgi:para-aminobenzoate synthetase/4-amino-4-deoxychorismate lyase
VLIDSEQGTAEYGVGGGIVWDSEAESEYEECKTKANVLVHPAPEFQLLETVLWQPDKGCWLLESHIARLEAAADYFKFGFNKDKLIGILEQTGKALDKPSRIRVLVDEEGEILVEHSPMGSLDGLVVGLASQASDTQTPFCYHKTTCRDVYRQALDCLPDCDEVILWNRDGLITESTRANVVIDTEQGWLTPALDAGLLPGVYREHLLNEGVIREADITLEQFEKAKAHYLINSVRGWLPLQKLGTGRWRVQQKK